MSSISTFYNSEISDAAEFICLFGFGTGLLGSGGDESSPVETEPLIFDEEILSRRDLNTTEALTQHSRVGADKYGCWFDHWKLAETDSEIRRLNSYFATLLMMRKSISVKLETTTEPLVDIDDIEQIRTNCKLLGCGVKTRVSKRLRRRPGYSDHKMLRAISAAQLLWQESFESDA